MLVFCLDTTSKHAHIGVYDSSQRKVLGSTSWDSPQSLSETLLEQTSLLFTHLNLNKRDIQGVLTNIGPGSFTGIRVSLNFARAWASSQPLVCHGVSQLEALAWQFKAHNNLPFIALSFAFRDIFYFERYTWNSNEKLPIGLLAATSAPLKEIQEKFPEDQLICLEREASQIGKATAFTVTSDILGEIWDSKYSRDKIGAWQQLLPFYIRQSEPEEKLNLMKK